eukprot:TRINITY_DN3295_c0_g1_i5.p1 TRINITY_DN3295_c0_g1~~TRINITY_DN3295_c0_g1_i5.p1  ORF type:complete len:278 (-),score=60.26 TRINITY_DN3295_c0_g1_i5:359-1192(-)
MSIISCQVRAPINFKQPLHRVHSTKLSVRRCSEQNSNLPDKPQVDSTASAAVKLQSPSADQNSEQDDLQSLLQDKKTQKNTEQKKARRRQADSTDWVASALTRRFGIAGGFVWLGILAVGSIGEQVKTRLEYAQEQADTKEVEQQEFESTFQGWSFRDIKIGGGQKPRRGDLAVINLKISLSDGQIVEDTFVRGKPIVLYFGGRPFTGGICEAVEEALMDMKAGGVREVVVPPQLGFGSKGAVLRPTEHVPEKQGIIPPGAELLYRIELDRVSIPPS